MRERNAAMSSCDESPTGLDNGRLKAKNNVSSRGER
jgi:hypothetical protein